MKLTLSFLTLACLALIAGCASNNKMAANETGPGHWVTLEPEVGSHVSRRVWVADGSTNAPSDSQVKVMNPDALRDIQRQGNVNSGRPGQ